MYVCMLVWVGMVPSKLWICSAAGRLKKIWVSDQTVLKQIKGCIGRSCKYRVVGLRE